MKLLLVRDEPKGGVGGYTQLKISDISNIDKASCDEIIVGDILDYYPNKGKLFQQIIEKLRYGGVIHISGIDLNFLCNEYVNGYITPADMINLLYNGKISIDTLQGIIAMCKHHNLEIVIEDISGQNYIVSAQRIKNGTANQQDTHTL